MSSGLFLTSNTGLAFIFITTLFKWKQKLIFIIITQFIKDYLYARGCLFSVGVSTCVFGGWGVLAPCTICYVIHRRVSIYSCKLRSLKIREPTFKRAWPALWNSPRPIQRPVSNFMKSLNIISSKSRRIS